MESCVRLEHRGATAIVTLHRPAALNAVNRQMRDELIAAFGKVNGDPAIRAVVVTGSGSRAFCSGQDLDEASQFQVHEIESWMGHQRAMFQSLRDVMKPTIAAFNGVAAGTGFQIGLLADLRVGYPEMHIGQPEVRVGFASIVGSYLMTMHLGLSHNAQLSLTGDLISGSRAYEIGLINYLVPCEEVMEKALAAAAGFDILPPTAIRLTKQRFREITQSGFEDACKAGLRAHFEDYQTGEPQEALRRFLAERATRARKPRSQA
jgi:enoyl-CoA hydratase/carnithine racemase